MVVAEDDPGLGLFPARDAHQDIADRVGPRLHPDREPDARRARTEMVGVDQRHILRRRSRRFPGARPATGRCADRLLAQSALHRLGRLGPPEVRQDERGVAVRDRQDRDSRQALDLLGIQTLRTGQGRPAGAERVTLVGSVHERAAHDRARRPPVALRVDRTLHEAVLERVGVQDGRDRALLLSAQDLPPLSFAEVAHQGHASLEGHAALLEGPELGHGPLSDIDHVPFGRTRPAVGAEPQVIGGALGERIVRDPVLGQ
ncbi:MAG: hypothetical protein AUI47_07610 [Acidobacteria bacterium 13_1_40CM_2_68_5]|nr:MAG: hypothetical protein AUI47_07610 [Acidobacteria bacterium 13_1_40CM_2_68_5]